MSYGQVIPNSVLDICLGHLSPAVEPGYIILPCGKKVRSSLQTDVPCDVESMQVTVTTGGEENEKTVTVFIPYTSSGVPRDDAIDVVCGVRQFIDKPMEELGPSNPRSQGEELKRVRDPARIKVSVTYASNCGNPDHNAIYIEPSGDEKDICARRVVRGTSTSFEAFRQRNAIEKSKLWIDGGAESIFGILRFLWTFIDDTDCGSVTIRAHSCGIRGSGPCVTDLATRINLYSEDEFEVELKLPPIFGEEGKKSDLVSPGKRIESSERKASKFLSYEAREESKVTTDKAEMLTSKRSMAGLMLGVDGDLSYLKLGSTTKQVGRKGKVPREKFSLKEPSWSDHLLERGLKFSLKHNGEELDFESVQSILNTWKTIVEAITKFKELWEAGPRVKISLGWSATWSLKFFEVYFSGNWSRRFVAGSKKLAYHRQLSATVRAVSGSLGAKFGFSVEIEKFYITVASVDFSGEIKLKDGGVTQSVSWAADRREGADWSSPQLDLPFSGELPYELSAVAKVGIIGRICGVKCSVSPGLKVSGQWHAGSPIPLERLTVTSSPVIVRIEIWVGSTGEADAVFEREWFHGYTVYSFSPS